MKRTLLCVALACATGIAGAAPSDAGQVSGLEVRNDGTVLFNLGIQYNPARCQNPDAPWMFRLASKVDEATRAEFIARLNGYPLARVNGTGQCVGGIEEVTVNFLTPLD